MLENLKKKVCEGNKAIKKSGLVIFTWGNLSAIDRNLGIVAIKPSGVSFEKLTPEDIVLLDLNGNIIEGNLNPSSDTKTHLELYKKFDSIGSIVHTHSTNATAFAQAKIPIICQGTTHADNFYGTIPIIETLDDSDILEDYEKNTGISITSHFFRNNINHLEMQACLVSSHGPFVWGKKIEEAVSNSIVLEKVAEIAQKTLSINGSIKSIKQSLLDKHYLRKNGEDKYYGQND